MNKLKKIIVAIVLLLSLLLSGCSQFASEPLPVPTPAPTTTPYKVLDKYYLKISNPNHPIYLDYIQINGVRVCSGNYVNPDDNDLLKITLRYYYLYTNDVEYNNHHYKSGDKAYYSKTFEIKCSDISDCTEICFKGIKLKIYKEGYEFETSPSPSPNPSPIPVPTPKSTPKQNSNSRQCFVTATGSCYHNHKCGNMNMSRVRYMSIQEAKDKGYRACSKCY